MKLKPFAIGLLLAPLLALGQQTISSNLVRNASTVTGSTVTSALDALKTGLVASVTNVDGTIVITGTGTAPIISRAGISGDVTVSTASNTAVVNNLPAATTAAGTIVHTNIAAPSSPAVGKDSVYTDSTDLRFHDKNAGGIIGTTVVADTGASNNFLTAISTAGAISKAQPAFSNLSGSATCAQEPALTGSVTSSAGSCATTVITNANLTGAITSVGNATTAAAIPTTALTGTITNAQLANAAAYTLKGNPTSSSAAPTDTQAPIIGTPGFTASNIFSQWTGSVNAFMQFAIQNTSNGGTASTDYIASNDQGTDTTHYVDLGINSSGFTGSGSLNIPGAGYLYSQTGDLVLGTGTSNGVHFVVNGGTTDAMAISSAGALTPTATTTAAGFMSAADKAFIAAYKDATIVLVTSNQYSNITCDGTTDDAAAWNALTAAAPADSVLTMPRCTSIIKSAITTAKHFAFKGQGQGRSIIRSTVNAADFITLGDWYSTVEGIEFDGLNTTVTSAIALSGTPTASLLVGSTTNAPASGNFYVQTNLGWTLATYTSIVDGTHIGGVTAAVSTTVAGGPITFKTGGFAVNAQAMNHVFVKDVWFNYVYNGFRTDGTICGILDSQIFGEVNFGIQMNGSVVNDIIHNVTADGIPPAVAHLEVNQAGSLLLSDNDFIRAQSDMRLNPTSPNGVFGVYAVNTYFDTATGVSGTANSGNGVLLQGTGNIQRLKIINSWLSSATHDGLWVNSTAATLPTDLELYGNNIYSNGANGVDLAAAQDVMVKGNQISGNTTSGITTAAAAGSVTSPIISLNRIGPAGGIGANGTGIIAAAGTYGSLELRGNDLCGNTTAMTLGAITVATWSRFAVTDNPCWNPHGAVTTPTFPTSTTVVTNQTGHRVSILLKSGATASTVVTVNGITTVLPLNSQITTYPLDPGGTIAQTFTVAGTWTWVGN